jgi:hypothetical protein
MDAAGQRGSVFEGPVNYAPSGIDAPDDAPPTQNTPNAQTPGATPGANVAPDTKAAPKAGAPKAAPPKAGPVVVPPKADAKGATP